MNDHQSGGRDGGGHTLSGRSTRADMAAAAAVLVRSHVQPRPLVRFFFFISAVIAAASH